MHLLKEGFKIDNAQCKISIQPNVQFQYSLQSQDYDQTETNDLMLFRSQFFQPAGLILRHHQEQQIKFQQQVS